ncbi:MAG: carboxypeptidase-like regulatory domain-containing protein [Bacteroidota bacterium]
MIKKLLYIVLFFLLWSSYAKAQDILEKKISISVTELPFDEVLSEIKRKTDIDFSYYSGLFKENQRFSVYKKDETVKNIIEYLLIGTNVSYGVFKGQLIFSRPLPKPDQEYSLSGYLTDSLSGKIISQAHIYLDLTDIGTLTDDKGFFRLDDIPEGAYDMVISHVSYGVHNFILNLNKNEEDLKVRIKPKLNILRELEIVSLKDVEYERYIKLFKREVLGETENAKLCVINNPQDLFIYTDSTYGKNEFEIYANGPLSVTNYALGYDIFIDLVFFEARESQVLFIARTNFSPVKSGSKKISRKWVKNRKDNYYGSIRHFSATMNKKRIAKKQFDRSIVDVIPDSLKFKYLPADIKSKEVLKLVALSKELNDGNYLEIYHPKSKSVSYISKTDFEFRADYKYELIKDYFDPKKGVVIYGDWAARRLADTLPLNFRVSSKKNKRKVRGKKMLNVN